ncbi:phage tail protein [Granulicella arctica]|uniref:Microcystin-dependent protein n=1 Tax=Granulicella arctica TaxID=940613 RepID=A0A7Y9PIQ6_9BACT|nr:tail fiber protein [Granulicella arctica]NYF80596.1 microcystin-dependent protein [Granulicella arctica]
MSNPYVGEIRLVGFNFAPEGWAICQGQLLSIAEYDVLFNLLGTTYGGDGQTTFALPDLQGRAPLHQGSSYIIGSKAGVETVTLTTAQLPQHTHAIAAQGGNGNTTSPGSAFFAGSTEEQYASGAGATSGTMLPNFPSVGSQPHDNRMPYLCMNYVISLFGIYPSQG